MRRISQRPGVCATAALAVCLVVFSPPVHSQDLEFNRDIRPILSDNCFSCHGPSSASRQADLRLDDRESAVASQALVPGQPDESELLRRILSTDPDEQMPPPETKKSLTSEQIELLRRWIASGAEYQAHWAFLPVPERVEIPAPADPHGWVRQPIDAFVLDRLSKLGAAPAPEAPPEQWLRRATFDLTGLPPTLAELDEFLGDSSPGAVDAAVSRLFASPSYGERLANDWLDAARYADTFGYQADRNMHVWPWRDWVIRAFQSNLSYREFIEWQIAGDMLPHATRDQKLATAFNRLHRQTNEGGSIEEEFRNEYVADRVRTMGSAFLGLTLECARCHDHKFDPISQREYYSLSAFFNNVDEHGLYSHFTETAPTPCLLLYEGDQEARHRAALQGVDQATRERDLSRREAVVRFAQLTEADPSDRDGGPVGVQATAGDAPSTGDAVAAASVPPAPASAVPADWRHVQPPEPVAAFSFDGLQPAGDYRPCDGRHGAAIEFGGDDQYVCAGAPELSRVEPFSISLWVRPHVHEPRQMLVHQSQAAEDSAFRGFSLVLDNGRPVVSLVHFWPGNALQVRDRSTLPVAAWTHLTATDDGSSRAAGVAIYVDGAPVATDVVRDRLTRDIRHLAAWGDSGAGSIPLALGARFRDIGFRGGAIDEFAIYDRRLSPSQAMLVAGRPAPDDRESLRLHYLEQVDPDVLAAEQRLRTARRRENDVIAQVRQIMVMQELPARRPTYVLARGAYDAPGEQVRPGTPEGIFSWPEALPANRLGFAQWVVDERNPLTARVAVNRIWTLFFGRGLVATPQDFGSQGQTPSHPELLDWLARDFMDHGWDVQRLCRMIVTSAAYRQSSTPADPALYARDPENRWLARGPRHRLSAEQLRDAALLASGLLKPKAGGPSVFPYQPAGLWEESGTGQTYHQSHGDDLYRRSLYTFWRRTAPPPSMTVFDAPTREYCVVLRERTATPLQSLALLNDPQCIEAARMLAQSLLQSPGSDEERIARLFRQLTSRRPAPAEREVLVRRLEQQRAAFRGRAAEAQQYLASGESPRDAGLDVCEHAAWTAIVQLLFNFDECTTKR